MKLPQGGRALVEDAKVRDYLLSDEHPVGRFKARAFASASALWDAAGSWVLLTYPCRS